jgi:dihydroorotate dehydrogenase
MDIAHSLYKALKPLIYKTDPEMAHEVMLWGGEVAGSTALTRALLALFYRYRGPDIGKTVDGIKYEIPILLSAGMDPNGRLTQALRDMSFGGEEIGSTTAYPCKGNPPPRMVRLPKNNSIIVYKGLRNHGVDVLIEKLKHTPRIPGYVIGISIALTNYRPESCATIEGAVEDFALSFKKLNEAGVGDYYTLNISCPNTMGGVEDMLQKPENLELLLRRIKSIPSTKPLYLKMPINLPWEHFEQLCDVADKNGVNGLIIGNLNKHYDDLEHRNEAPEKFRGGLSGKPCFNLSNELLRRVRAKYGKRFTLIGVGGILSPDDAMEKLKAGADLLMLISGMIFYSPSLMKHICERLGREQVRI